jgi:hypothetical protein
VVNNALCAELVVSVFVVCDRLVCVSFIYKLGLLEADLWSLINFG